MSISIRFTYTCDSCGKVYLSPRVDSEEFDASGDSYRPAGWRYLSGHGDICDNHQVKVICGAS
jgi:uncharacterized OB-fold protein